MTTDKRTHLSAGDRIPKTARARLLATFDSMLLRKDSHRQRARAIAAEAGIARTTFYDHFQSTSDLELAAVQRPLEAIADLATGAVCPAAVERWFTHFWEYRSECRRLIGGPLRQRIERMLAALIEQRLCGADHRLLATQASALLLASLDAWLHGRITLTGTDLTQNLSQACAALRLSVVNVGDGSSRSGGRGGRP